LKDTPPNFGSPEPTDQSDGKHATQKNAHITDALKKDAMKYISERANAGAKMDFKRPEE
jgi:hypothetical protein